MNVVFVAAKPLANRSFPYVLVNVIPSNFGLNNVDVFIYNHFHDQQYTWLYAFTLENGMTNFANGAIRENVFCQIRKIELFAKILPRENFPLYSSFHNN